MNGETTSDVRDLIERLRAGDDSARQALLERVHHRLRRIAAAALRKEFPRLRAQHDLDSVVDEAWVQLMKALETTRPATVEGFFSLVFLKVNHVLLDMARRQGRHDHRREPRAADPGSSEDAGLGDVPDTTHEPARLAVWTELHREVEKLPETQRLVFNLYYLADFSQAETARLLDLHPKEVSRLWLAAAGRLAEWLGEYRI
jgi:RNA polymerase sigma-70 factor (ECF subfamily)